MFLFYVWCFGRTTGAQAFLGVTIVTIEMQTTVNPPKALSHNVFHLKLLPARTPAVSLVFAE